MNIALYLVIPVKTGIHLGSNSHHEEANAVFLLTAVLIALAPGQKRGQKTGRRRKQSQQAQSDQQCYRQCQDDFLQSFHGSLFFHKGFCPTLSVGPLFRRILQELKKRPPQMRIKIVRWAGAHRQKAQCHDYYYRQYQQEFL
jgi:hypothetical protein